MKTIRRDNIVITKEMTDNRFYDKVSGYKVNEDGNPVAFLGKYIIPSNYTEDEIVELYNDPWSEDADR